MKGKPSCSLGGGQHEAKSLSFPEGVLPFPEGLLPFPEGVLPFTDCVLPFAEGVLLFPKGVLPFPECVLSFTKCVLPFTEWMLPFPVGVLPFSDCVLPFPEGVLPFPESVLPFTDCVLPFQRVYYLLQSVYSSLLVTPRGGGRKCQPSCDPAGHNHGYFAILTFPVRQQLLRNPHLKHQPKVDLNTSKITHPSSKLIYNPWHTHLEQKSWRGIWSHLQNRTGSDTAPWSINRNFCLQIQSALR